MNQHQPPHSRPIPPESLRTPVRREDGPPVEALPVGDVLVRQDDAGYGIFNYRGEPVLDAPLHTMAEATRLATEIVSPWRGRVRLLGRPEHG